MKVFILFFSISFALYAKGQTIETKVRTYSALYGDIQEAYIEKNNLKKGSTEKVSLGKYASIIIDYTKQTLTIKTQFQPVLQSKTDSMLLYFTQHSYVSTEYKITKSIPLSQMPQYTTEAFLIQLAEDKTQNYMFLATSKSGTNICDNVYIVFMDDENYFISLNIPKMMWDN